MDLEDTLQYLAKQSTLNKAERVSLRLILKEYKALKREIEELKDKLDTLLANPPT